MSYTVYLNEPFAGSSGTILTSLADALWTNSASYVAGSNAIEVDGNGYSFLSGADSANIPNVSMPLTPNFEVFVDHKRLTALSSGQTAGVTLFVSSPYASFATKYYLGAIEPGLAGTGVAFFNGATAMGSTAALPSVGVNTRLRIRVTTTGGNTTFQCSSSTDGVTYTDLGISATIATPTQPVAIGLYYQNRSGSGGWTATTGPHLGRLIVEDLSATTATLSIASGSGVTGTPVQLTVNLDRPAGYGGISDPVAQAGGTGTLSAAAGGPTISSITIAQGASSGNFWWNPSAAGTASISDGPTAPVLTLAGSPQPFTAAATATGYTISGATSGFANIATGNIVVTPNGYIASDTITITLAGASGSISSSTLTFTATNAAQSVTFTGAAAGTAVLTFSSSSNLTVGGSPLDLSIAASVTFDSRITGMASGQTPTIVPKTWNGFAYSTVGSGLYSLGTAVNSTDETDSYECRVTYAASQLPPGTTPRVVWTVNGVTAVDKNPTAPSVLLDGNLSFGQALNQILAGISGVLSGVPPSGAGTLAYKSPGGAPRIAMGVDGTGNRTSITHTPPIA
jgi:hypothetical protein